MKGFIYLALVLSATQARPQDDRQTRATDECPAEGHWLLPHEYDCTKFYYCEYGQKVNTPRDCAPGTQFSYAMQVCIHPVLANCNLSGIPPATEEPTVEAETEATTSAPTTTEASTTTTSSAPSSTQGPVLPTITASPTTTEAPATEEDLLPNGCPSDPSVHKLLAHETECNLFYYCENGEKVLSVCAAGTDFNPTLQVCDWPENAGCANSGNETNTTSAPTITEATTTEAATTEAATTEAATTEAATTEAATTEAATTEAATTEAATTEAATTEADTTEAATTEAATIEAATLPNGCPSDFSVHKLLPHETECNLFYYCNFGEKVQRECAPGTHFNPILEVCDWPENAGCANSGNETTTIAAPTTTEAASNTTTEEPVTDGDLLPNGCPSDFSVHKLLPHETECNLFFYCNFGEKVQRECAPGTHFNPTLEVCDWPENAGCANSGNETTTTSAPTTTEATDNTTTEEPVTGGDLLPNGCPSDFSVHKLLPHETECNLFYYCNFGEKVQRECAPGTHFNPTLEVCDWPENAGCTNTGNESTSTSAPTTTEAATTEAATTEAATTEAATTEAATTEAATTEAATTEAAVDNGCPTDWDVHKLLPHESDCGKFYQCVHGEPVERECPSGTHFNAALEVCDWPENAGCTNTGNESTTTSAPTTTEAATTEAATTEAATTEAAVDNDCPTDWDVHKLLPHESDCGKFYQCVHGEPVERECPSGTHFNAALEVCDWPENAGCTNTGNESTTTSAPTTTEAAATEAATTEAATTEAATTEAATTEAATTEAATTEAATTEAAVDNGCPTDWDVHKLLPHESDCGKFYQCVHGEPVERECPSGTHFNAALEVCDWPENAGCTNTGNESTTTSAPTTTEAATTEAAITEAATTEAATTEAATTEAATTEAAVDNGCPTDWDVHKLLPHESDCGKFYQCVHGEPVERECPSGTHFNAALEVCDWPENAGCTNTGNESTTTSAPTTTEAAATEAATTEAATTEAATTEAATTEAATTEAATTEAATTEAAVDNGCPTDWDVHKLLPHESDCGKFYQCVHGEPVERECPSGTHFNAALEVCDWPENAGCTNTGNESTTTSAPTTTEAATTEAATTEAATTEAATTEAATTEAATTEAATTEAAVDNDCPTDWDVHKLLPHESDCGKFYQCVHGEPVERECPSGTHFNAALEVCDWPENAGCTNTGNESTTTSAPTTTEAAATEAATTEAATTEAATTEAATTEAATTEAATTEAATTEAAVDNGCPTDWDVHKLLPHESDCGKFYQCVHGEPVERECPSGTHFNAALEVCDWPENAGCTNTGNESTTTSAPTTTEAAATEAATTEAATTEAATTEAATTEAATTEAATTEAATTEAAVDNGCPTDWDVHKLLPHESDCGKFYQCVHGEPVERECPSGTHFNAALEVCDWPENAGCTNTGNESTTTSAPTTTEAATTEAATTEAATTEAATTEAATTEAATTEAATTEAATTEAAVDNGCPTDWDVHKLLPHESDCGKFYQCVHGEPVERECPSGTHFNAALEVCDWPENAGCANSGNETTTTSVPSSTDSAATEAATTEADTTEAATTEAATTEAATLPNGCPSDFSVHQLLPHETECNLFYYCNFGDKVLRECAPGTHFNPTLQVCDWPENAGCANSGNETTTTSVPSSTDSAATEAATTEAATTEAATTEAAATEAATTDAATTEAATTEAATTEAATTEDATTENATTEAATTAAATTEAATLPNGCPSDFGVHQLLPHETECNLFYYCNFGDKVLRECAPGTHFNPTLQVCDWPENAGCANSGNETTTTSAPTTTEATHNNTTEEPVTEGDLLPNGCPSDFSVHKLLPHETECNLFYYCNFGEKVERECAPGTHFNPTLEVCDWPENAGCANSGNETTTTSAPTTTEAVTTEAAVDNGCPTDWDVHKLLPHESDCGKFYQCVHGEPVERECPSGTHFNAALEVCDWPENAGCANSSNATTTTEAPTTTEAANITTTEAPANITTTEAPANITTTEAPTTTEAANITTTEAPANITTTEAPTTTEAANITTTEAPANITTTEAPTTTESANITTTEAPANITTTEAPTTTEEPGTEEDAKCAAGCNVLPWAHEADCDKFWSCDGEKAVLTVCSEGLHYNANTYTCDFICNANCVRDTVQATVQNDGVRIFLPWDGMDEETINKFVHEVHAHDHAQLM